MGANSAKPPEPENSPAGQRAHFTRNGPSQEGRRQAPASRHGYHYPRLSTREHVQASAPWHGHPPAPTGPVEDFVLVDNFSANRPSNIAQSADPNSAITELFANWDDFKLFYLTKVYRDRLEQAMEGRVKGVNSALTIGRHFNPQEHRTVADLTDRGHRADSCKLLVNLVMEKGSRARRVMWESLMKMWNQDPKLIKILSEILEQGSTPYAYLEIAIGSHEFPRELTGAQRKHKATLGAQTEKVNASMILRNGNIKVCQMVDQCADITVVSTARNRKFSEHELLARGRDHEQSTDRQIPGRLKKIRNDQLFQSSPSHSGSKSGSTAAVAGVSGIGKTTMVQKIVHDWATGKIYQHFQFVFSFKFRDLNSINFRINLRDLILDQYPYLRNVLGEVWRNAEKLLFTFDGLDEFKDRMDFADSRRDTEPQHVCTDPEIRCNVSDIVYSLIQHKLLPGCSVLVTTRPTALHLLGKAEISVWAEILGFIGEERKEYFHRYFEDQTVAAAVFKHVEENEMLYTMSYNPSYCWILVLALGSFFSQIHSDPQRVPKTITQLYSYYIYNILKNHGREIESPRDVLLSVGQMAFTGVSERNVVFTDGDLLKYNLQTTQFTSSFSKELLERGDSARSVVYTFPHLTIQEFGAALAQFLTPDPGDILKLLTDARDTADGRFELFLRFVAGLSSPGSAGPLCELLGPFPHQTTCRVIDWVKEEVKRQTGNTGTEAGKKSFLNTMHYLFESQNSELAQGALGSVEALSFRRFQLTPSDCTVLSSAIGFCNGMKHLDLRSCRIQCEGLERLGHGLHKCQELGLGNNHVGDSGVKVVSAALRNPECEIQKLRFYNNGLKPSCAKELASALITNCSLKELDLAYNDLGDSGVKLVSTALRKPDCKIQRLRLDGAGLTDSCTEDLAWALRTNCSLTELKLGSNSFTDLSVPALRRLILTHRNLNTIGLRWNMFSSDGGKQLTSLQEFTPRLSITV